jgi:hypothetical protein
VRERLDHPDLLLVALRQSPDRSVEVEPEPVGERPDPLHAATAAQLGELVQQLPCGPPAVRHTQLAGQVPDPGTQPGSTVARGRAEHLDAARGRTQQVEQDADERRLARAVRAEEAEDLTRRHLEVDPVQRADAAAVDLHEPLGPDDGGHGAPSSVAASASRICS